MTQRERLESVARQHPSWELSLLPEVTRVSVEPALAIVRMPPNGRVVAESRDLEAACGLILALVHTSVEGEDARR